MKGCAPWPLCSSLTQHDAGILELRGTIWYGRVWCTYMLGVILFQKLIVSSKRCFNHLTKHMAILHQQWGKGKASLAYRLWGPLCSSPASSSLSAEKFFRAIHASIRKIHQLLMHVPEPGSQSCEAPVMVPNMEIGHGCWVRWRSTQPLAWCCLNSKK